MKLEDHYHRFVRWYDEDRCYIGYCPDPRPGDYTATRQSQPDAGTMEDLCAEIRIFEANASIKCS